MIIRFEQIFLSFIFFPQFLTEPSGLHGQHEHAHSLLGQVSAGLLWAALAALAVSSVRERLPKADVRARPSESIVEVGVEGLTCNGCVRKLTRQLNELEGAIEVRVEREPSGLAIVRGHLSKSSIDAAIRAAGFTPLAPASHR